MSIDEITGLATTLFLMAYCLASLLWPERF